MRKLIVFMILSLISVDMCYSQVDIAKNFNKNLFNIYPIMKTKDQIENFDQLMANKENNSPEVTMNEDSVINETKADIQPVHSEPLIKKYKADLYTFYAIIKGKEFKMLERKDVPESISLDELDEIARENLYEEAIKNLQANQNGYGAVSFSCGGYIESSLLLLPDIWKYVKSKLGDKVLFVVPSNHKVYFIEANNKQGLKQIYRISQTIAEQDPDSVSDKLYYYNEGDIKSYDFSTINLE